MGPIQKAPHGSADGVFLVSATRTLTDDVRTAVARAREHLAQWKQRTDEAGAARDQKFDESKIKDLTGGDAIACRRMNEDWWDFTPTHTLFLHGQHKPVVSGHDLGIWRRMRLIPWTFTVPANAEIAAKLCEAIEKLAKAVDESRRR